MAFEALPVNYFAAALIAAVASILVGRIWYNVLFGKIIKKMHGGAKPRKGTFLLTLVGNVLMAYALGVLIVTMSATTVPEAISIGLLLWIGFVVPLKLSGVLWEKKPGKVYLLEIIEKLIALVVMSIILMY